MRASGHESWPCRDPCLISDGGERFTDHANLWPMRRCHRRGKAQAQNGEVRLGCLKGRPCLSKQASNTRKDSIYTRSTMPRIDRIRTVWKKTSDGVHVKGRGFETPGSHSCKRAAHALSTRSYYLHSHFFRGRNGSSRHGQNARHLPGWGPAHGQVGALIISSAGAIAMRGWREVSVNERAWSGVVLSCIGEADVGIALAAWYVASEWWKPRFPGSWIWIRRREDPWGSRAYVSWLIATDTRFEQSTGSV